MRNYGRLGSITRMCSSRLRPPRNRVNPNKKTTSNNAIRCWRSGYESSNSIKYINIIL
jgi:hypothetical protein